MGKRAESILDTSRSNGCPALGRIESPPRPRMAAVLRPSPNDRGSATHLQERLLGDVPKFPLVPMECGSRGHPSHDGRIPSTQTLREPATVGGSDVADGAHSPRDLAVRPVHRPRRPGILPLATGVLRKRLHWAEEAKHRTCTPRSLSDGSSFFWYCLKDDQSFRVRDYAHNHSRRCSAPENRHRRTRCFASGT